MNMATCSSGRQPLQPPSFEVEALEDYRRGGFCPITIGQCLYPHGTGRWYRIVHKLGWGAVATVWLARDDASNKWVTIKICQAKNFGGQLRELGIHQSLLQAESQHEGKKYVIPILDHFSHRSANGCHDCYVMPVAGADLFTIGFDNDEIGCKQRRWNKDAARHLARQLLLVVDYVHSQGVVHGDVTPFNVVLQLNGIHKLSEDEMLKFIGQPESQRCLRMDGSTPNASAPSYHYKMARTQNIPMRFLALNIWLIDFGCSQREPVGWSRGGPPFHYAAPEAILHRTQSREADMWSVACTIFELRTGMSLFPANSRKEFWETAQVTLSRVPEKYLAAGVPERLLKSIESGGMIPLFGVLATIDLRFRCGFLDMGIVRSELNTQQHPFERCDTPLDGEEVALLALTLRSALDWEPQDRSTAEALLDYPWISDRDAADTLRNIGGSHNQHVARFRRDFDINRGIASGLQYGFGEYRPLAGNFFDRDAARSVPTGAVPGVNGYPGVDKDDDVGVEAESGAESEVEAQPDAEVKVSFGAACFIEDENDPTTIVITNPTLKRCKRKLPPDMEIARAPCPPTQPPTRQSPPAASHSWSLSRSSSTQSARSSISASPRFSFRTWGPP